MVLSSAVVGSEGLDDPSNAPKFHPGVLMQVLHEQDPSRQQDRAKEGLECHKLLHKNVPVVATNLAEGQSNACI